MVQSLFLFFLVFTLCLSGVASGCGGPKDLTGTGGTVSSMGYPGSYNNKARCQWNIQVSTGKIVHLQFHNFSLEESQMCMNDKVSLSDRIGNLGMGAEYLFSSSLQLLMNLLSHTLMWLLLHVKSLFHIHLFSGTYCSHVPPEDLVSDGNTLRISFSSNDKVVDTGFTATWRAVDPTDGKRGEKCT